MKQANSEDFTMKQVYSIKEMAVNEVVASRSGVQNPLSTFEVDYASASREYADLLNLVSKAADHYKQQLTAFIYPIFVHLFLELIVHDKEEEAQRFYEENNNLFVKTEGYASAMKELCEVRLPSDVKTHPYFKLFRDGKYSVKLSEDCLEYFVTFLKEEQHNILFQLISLYFLVDIRGSDDQGDSQCDEETEGCTEGRFQTMRESNKYVTREEQQRDALRALRAAIMAVSANPPCVPSVRSYGLWNDGQCSLCDVDISLNSALLAAAYDNSAIHLWSLVPDRLFSDDSDVDVSRVSLACDVVDDDEEAEAKQMLVLRGHGGPVYGVSFATGGQLMVSCSDDTTVRAWDTKTHKNVAIYSGHRYPIWDIEMSPMSLYFATASMDNTARMWTTERTFPLLMLAGHETSVECVKFHPNCNYIATGSLDKTVRLWNVQDGRTVRLLVGHAEGITSIAFSPDGRYLASASRDQKIKIWDLSSGLELCEFSGHSTRIYSLSFNSDCSVLASGGLENCIRLWDVQKFLPVAKTADFSDTGTSAANRSALLSSFLTQCSTVQFVQFCEKNLLLSAGVSNSSEQNNCVCE